MNKKVALVTGGSRGIGKAISTALAEAGIYVVINYNGSAEKAEALVMSLQQQGYEAESRKCNVADFSAVETMIKEITAAHGRLDILVNNAGITKDNLLLKMSEAEYDDVLAVNLKGYFNTIRHSTRQMIRQRSGKIINISSVSGVMGNAGQTNYSAAKAGVIGLTKSAARELASRNITVNAVAPGFIETEMTEVLSEQTRAKAADQIPLTRFGRAEEVAQLVAYLASEQADYITGQVISIDGGMAI